MPAPRLQATASEQKDLFAAKPSLPAGFAYRDDLITPAEELGLLKRLEDLPFKPFEFHGYLGKRRVVSFGWRYDYGARTLQASDPIPDFLLALRSGAADFAGVSAQSLQQILINEYAAGAGIGWHRDKAAFDIVCGLSLGSACPFRFRRKAGERWQRFTLTCDPRSLYMMAGEARSIWEHSIAPVDQLRYSITFRSLR